MADIMKMQSRPIGNKKENHTLDASFEDGPAGPGESFMVENLDKDSENMTPLMRMLVTLAQQNPAFAESIGMHGLTQPGKTAEAFQATLRHQHIEEKGNDDHFFYTVKMVSKALGELVRSGYFKKRKADRTEVDRGQMVYWMLPQSANELYQPSGYMQ
jgi:hypothetical protein